MSLRQNTAPRAARILICALPILAPSWAAAQSAPFRQAVESGHRDRLTQVCPNCTPFERQLAQPQSVWTGTKYSGAAAEPAAVLAAQYALAKGDGPAALKAASACVEQMNSEAAGSEAQWLLAQSELLAGQPREAMERADWLSRNAAEPYKSRGLFAQAQCALALRDTAEALRLFKICTRNSKHEVAPAAYLEMGALHEARGESERAMHYLTLYRESYPRGLMPQFDFSTGGSSRADAMAGVQYTIQVGVFGDRSNAVRLSDQLKRAGHKSELVPRTISGQKYTAVWVGRYSSQSEAQEARKRLEDQFSDTYRVVVRE